MMVSHFLAFTKNIGLPLFAGPVLYNHQDGYEDAEVYFSNAEAIFYVAVTIFINAAIKTINAEAIFINAAI